MKVNSLADGVLDRVQELGSAGDSAQFMSHYSSVLVGCSHFYSSFLLYLGSIVDHLVSRKLKATFFVALMSKLLQAACKFSHRL